jgi:hypothetical protein
VGHGRSAAPVRASAAARSAAADVCHRAAKLTRNPDHVDPMVHGRCHVWAVGHGSDRGAGRAAPAAVRCGFRRRRGYAYLYSQAPVFPGAGVDLATVGVGDGSHDGQSESGSAAGRTGGGVGEAFGGRQAAEGLKQARDCVGRDERPGGRPVGNSRKRSGM